jgi:hypothetical protein
VVSWCFLKKPVYFIQIIKSVCADLFIIPYYPFSLLTLVNCVFSLFCQSFRRFINFVDFFQLSELFSCSQLHQFLHLHCYFFPFALSIFCCCFSTLLRWSGFLDYLFESFLFSNVFSSINFSLNTAFSYPTPFCIFHFIHLYFFWIFWWVFLGGRLRLVILCSLHWP